MIKLNGLKIDIQTFPNKESLIKSYNINKNEENKITFKFEDESEFIYLYMIKKNIDDLNGTAILYLPYIPYSRMDRVEDSGFCYTLKYFTDFLNELKFDKVIVLEPHSDVSIALINRVETVNSTFELFDRYFNNNNFDFSNNDYVVFPDSGAEKRYSKQILVDNTLCAIKHRDFKTGNIKSLDILGDVPNKPFRAVIVDDLCSKGGTFVLTANTLKEMGATEIYLIVTHCETTIFDGEILKQNSNIDKVFCTDSILETMYLNLVKNQFEMCFGKNKDRNKLNVESFEKIVETTKENK